ncbi:MAG: ribosome biogenesis/translation initiation ATPase RLI [Nanoarchaeota archaeon]
MVKRLAIVERDKCAPSKCGNYWCIGACPVNRNSQDCIYPSDVDKKVIIDEELCIGCGICVRCPFDAIKIINLPERLQTDPVHRYGRNLFELFTLPVPKKNAVVGLLGRNGIGKSTALQILSGDIIPNLGDYKSKPNQESVINKFAHVALGDHFRKLYDQRIKISYKPQRVELLPKTVKGTVNELIKKVDETGKGDDVLHILNMELVKNRDINKLSGGELQRLAIAAAVVKKFDILLLDEPASFLDISQRVQVAKLIRNIASNSSVIVVEHDLATLDYVSDEIQVAYGEQVAYGVVAQSKSVKRGINEYLDGYLPDDNVRFRDYGIKFSVPLPKRERQTVLFEYPYLKKIFEGFTLDVEPGFVNSGEVLAVMGQNGLGKSTFLKLLAGVEHSDSGKVPDLSISYKPQYLEADEQIVQEYLQAIAGVKFSSGWYKHNILEKLNLKPLLLSRLSTLSGGELQKVQVAACLSRNAEVFAFDEPSAFIDVEDRLKVAEVIKEFVQRNEVSALIVDHDVQFVDYVADSMLVFGGVCGKSGFVSSPVDKRSGMNKVLKMLDITYRQDSETNRPRINKPNSQLDVLQKKKGEYYYK